MDVSIEQVECQNLAELSRVLILRNISFNTNKEVLNKKCGINYIILSDKSTNIYSGKEDKVVQFVDGRSFFLNMISLLEKDKEVHCPWSIFETSCLKVHLVNVLSSDNSRYISVNQGYYIELAKKYDYGYIQFYSRQDCLYNGKEYPRRSLITFFVYRNILAMNERVFPPFQSIRVFDCPIYLPVLPGQGIQVVASSDVSLSIDRIDSVINFVGVENRCIFDNKELVRIHRFVCKKRATSDENIVVLRLKDKLQSTRCPIVIPASIREGKEGLFPIFCIYPKRFMISAQNAQGFILKRLYQETLSWIYNSDQFIVSDDHRYNEVKVRFTGNFNYAIMQFLDGFWLLYDSDHIVMGV